MQKLKAQLHLHTKEDPLDNISLSAREMIDLAAKHGFEVLAITCHNVMIWNDHLKEVAASKNILLIPGIEKTIQKKHVLILNATVEAQKINTFDQLRTYKATHPNILIIAPHPFYGKRVSLNHFLEQNIDLFDAIEYSWFHGKKFDKYNKKAVAIAKKHNKPLIATGDTHLPRYLNYTYSNIEGHKDIQGVFQAIKNNKIEIISQPLPFYKMPLIYAEMLIRELYKKLLIK